MRIRNPGPSFHPERGALAFRYTQDSPKPETHPVNTDLMNNARPADVATAVMSVVDRLQHVQPHVQAMAAAALFVLLAERWGVEPQDVMTATKNLLIGSEGKRAEFEAVALYLENEL